MEKGIDLGSKNNLYDKYPVPVKIFYFGPLHHWTTVILSTFPLTSEMQIEKWFSPMPCN